MVSKECKPGGSKLEGVGVIDASKDAVVVTTHKHAADFLLW